MKDVLNRFKLVQNIVSLTYNVWATFASFRPVSYETGNSKQNSPKIQTLKCLNVKT